MSLMDAIRQAFAGRKGGQHGSPRKAVRLMISYPVRLRVASASIDQPALLEDLSSLGACVRTASPLHAGDSVILNVHLSPSMRFEQTAKVVYVQRPANNYQARCGLRFIDVRAEVKLKIVNYIEQERHGRAFGVQPFSHTSEPA